MHYPNNLNAIFSLWLFAMFFQANTLVDAMGMLPISIYISKNSGGQKCCSYGGGGGGGGGGKTLETFDDGLPLSFYRQQVSKLYGMGGAGKHGAAGGGVGAYGGGGGGGGGGHGGGKMTKMPKMKMPKMPSYQQLYKNSFRYPNIMMGGGFMKGDAFGPMGKHTSKKWRGYGKDLLRKIKSSGGQYMGDKLTFVQVVPSGATDEYKDSYVTLIADSMKQQPAYNNY